jgi:hypothetical protein
LQATGASRTLRRLKSRHRHLIDMHEKLQDEHRRLEEAFNEVLQLNSDLVGEMRRLKAPQRFAPSHFVGLMGR